MTHRRPVLTTPGAPGPEDESSPTYGPGDYFDRYSHRLEGEVDSRTAELVARTRSLEQQTAVLSEQAALLDLVPDAIVVRNMESTILFWNRGAELLTGWLSAEALGQTSNELLHTEFPEPLEQILATVLRTARWEGEVVYRVRDGTRKIVASRWALQRDAAGGPLRVLTIGNDITGRKQAEAELQLLHKRLSLATAVAKVGVWEWDLASNALTWDATMFELYGFPAVVPMPYERWSRTVRPEDLPAVEAVFQRAIHEKGQGSAEFRITLPDGSMRNMCAVEKVVLDEQGNVTRLIGVNMDVTERKEAEQARDEFRQDRMQFKDDFLSHVSHELRSPLTAIKQFSTILLRGLAGELNPEQRAYQQIVLKNIRQLQSMIDDLLEVTRLEAGKLTVEPERVSVTNAVTDTFNTLQETASAKGVTLSYDLPPDLPTADADPTRLRQVLINLIDNAIKFTPDGGAVTVQARVQPQDPRFLLFEVSDTGCGISPAVAARVFERLYQVSEHIQASRKGLGLGLYICKDLVTRQGGLIWVESRPGGGTTFSFTVPVFSLDSSIAPLLKDDEWPAASLALVMVESCLPGAWPSREAQEEWRHEARALLQRCLLPDMDVLLPTTSSGARKERFFIAAFTDETGASVLATRIRGQFDRLLPQKQAGLALSVSYSMLTPQPHEAGASTESIVTSMATHLEASIQSQLIPAGGHHE